MKDRGTPVGPVAARSAQDPASAPSRRVALVTGASRGIGKATAVALAEAGFDVAITARTMHRGEGRDDSDVGHGRPIPGSLEETAEEIERRGARAVALNADLLDHRSLEAAVTSVLTTWGSIDLLVNNAIHTGTGGMVPFVDLSIEQLRSRLEANVVSQVVVIKAVLPAMFKASRGTIVDITSTVAVTDPPAPVGQGGWGIGYAASKGAFHRIAGILAVELGARGLRAYNVDPGYVNTERQLLNAADNGLEGHYVGAPPSVPASVVVWLATAPYAAAYNGQTIKAQKFALDHALHPPWRQRGQQPSPLNN